MQSDLDKKNNQRQLRLFGLICSVIFYVLFIYFYFESSNYSSHMWLLIVGALFMFMSFINPQLFSKIGLFQLWIKFGHILHWITSHIFLFLFFYFVLTPFAIIWRLFGNDSLSKKGDEQKVSYFIERKNQPGPMKYQF